MSGGRKMFVNLPVKDLGKSVAFFTRLGFTFNPQFTDENATCMIVAEDTFVMLLVEKYFRTFIHKPVADASKTTEAIIALSANTRQEVDDMFQGALAAGGTATNPVKDLGFMYSASFQDPDHHQWEVVYMDMAAFGAMGQEAHQSQQQQQ
jgi:predicted lactoylglutathione lyase